MFFSIVNVEEGNDGRLPILKAIGAGYMLVFRLIFWWCVYSAVITLVTVRDAARRAGRAVLISAAFLTFVITYSLPFLAAVAYERYMIPLVPVTLLYLVFMLNERVWCRPRKCHPSCG